MSNPLELYEVNTYVFVVKIWLEESTGENDEAVWRGHITSQPSGERRYFQSLEELVGFIEPYLERMGVKRSRQAHLWEWFRRKKASKP